MDRYNVRSTTRYFPIPSASDLRETLAGGDRLANAAARGRSNIGFEDPAAANKKESRVQIRCRSKLEEGPAD